jgi:uncharacterized Fe-S cluster protein YjdI
MPRESFSYKNDDIKVIWRPGLCIHSRLCWTQLRSVFNPSKKPWIHIAGAETNRIIEQVNKCPSGALSFAWLHTPEELPADSLLPTAKQDDIPRVECLADGPLLVHGKFVIQKSDGTETLEEGVIALCRCGGSANKPFCDGTHEANGFKA